jgi:hypothetical protein
VRVDFPAKEQRSNPAQQRISHIKARTFKNRYNKHINSSTDVKKKDWLEKLHEVFNTVPTAYTRQWAIKLEQFKSSNHMSYKK